jgi:F0F1-type ATP synthase membrane subunit b/b'
MAELKLKPELIPMVIQGGFYLAALVTARILLVKPLLALTNERRRRTEGAVDSAKGLEIKLERLEKSYKDAHQSAMSEARDLLNNQVLAGQAEAAGILQQAQEASKQKLKEIRDQVAYQIANEREKVPATVLELTDAALARLSKNSVVVCALLTAALSAEASAAGGAGPVDPIYGILWPYFQFLVFVAALTFLAKKGISKMLEGRRDSLRTKLSEAREAMILAQRKSEEYEAKLKNLQAEIEALRADFANEGVRQRDKLIHDANEAAAQILRDTERVGRQMISEGKEQLRKEIFEQIVVALDKKLTGETLTNIDGSLRRSALAGLRNSTQLPASN